jgi:3-oxochol-4-en-24-oyl-CoA dehydrogenase
MPIAITDEHRELASVVRSFAARHDLISEARVLLDEPESTGRLWKEVAELGWLGLHVPEVYGGQGYGVPELSVVVEELGRSVMPGPFLPTVIVSAVLERTGDATLKERWLPGLASGSLVAGVGFGPLVLGAGLADVLLVADGDDMVMVERAQATVTARDNLDPTRRVAEVVVPPGAGSRLPGARTMAMTIARALGAAEAAGLAQACTEMAVEYAKVREQFGRVIGSFMAVKHHCANMKVQAELAVASAWDAAAAVAAGGREAELAAAVAAAVAFPAAIFCSQMNIQVLGGIGYTWEHDAHLFLRRAGAITALFGPAALASTDVHRLVRSGVSRHIGIELPEEAESHRKEVRAFLEGFTSLPEEEQRRRLVDTGYLQPHWPKPWGREAGPVEQIVIEEEFAAAGVNLPDMGMGAWVCLTFTQHGTDDQRNRWTRPSLLGEMRWCQLFSEPNAGSDAAGVQTSGTRVDGGWLVNGQKLWTSRAQFCTHGFATIRTDPEAPKHAGVTTVAIDLKAKGVTIQPLRAITGRADFNEVFFDDVFVPDDDVVGPVNGGWSVARATLGNERVTIGSGRIVGRTTDEGVLFDLAGDLPDGGLAAASQIGATVSEGLAIKLINTRSVIRAVAGSVPSLEGNVTKLLNSEHGQRVAELSLALAGANGAVIDSPVGVAAEWILARSRTIAGGTSEIGRNQIGEHLLGLPREPGLGRKSA